MLLYLTVAGRRYLGGVLWRLSTATSGSERKRAKEKSMSHARILIKKKEGDVNGRIRSDENRNPRLRNTFSGSEGFTLTLLTR